MPPDDPRIADGDGHRESDDPPTVTFVRTLNGIRNGKIGAVTGIVVAATLYLLATVVFVETPSTRTFVLYLGLALAVAVAVAIFVALGLTAVSAVRVVRSADEDLRPPENG
ncbi:hypothetical protein BRD17_03205 [Halobacteriales archaeon SW_7_68_16]|nr:MAG: hypothetical protein BRD17_03205 [Halobacteriales archaeon SW_7_68_16]